jgi:hypothetical protein
MSDLQKIINFIFLNFKLNDLKNASGESINNCKIKTPASITINSLKIENEDYTS